MNRKEVLLALANGKRLEAPSSDLLNTQYVELTESQVLSMLAQDSAPELNVRYAALLQTVELPIPEYVYSDHKYPPQPNTIFIQNGHEYTYLVFQSKEEANQFYNKLT